MSSLLDKSIKTINTEMQVASTRIVHTTVANLLTGQRIDPSIVSNAVGMVLGRTVGGMFNQANLLANQAVNKMFGRVFKNSSLNFLAGGVASRMLLALSTGNTSSIMSMDITNSVARGITQELFAKLPKSLTKSVSVNVLGTQISTGLAPIIGQALSSTVAAVIRNGASLVAPGSMSVPGINKIPSLFSDPLDAITSPFANIMSSIKKTVVGLGSFSGGGLLNERGIDFGRFTSISPGVSALDKLTSTGLGVLSKQPG